MTDGQDTYEMTGDRTRGAWMRVLDADGRERAAVLVMGTHTFQLENLGDGLPLIGDHLCVPPDDGAAAHELVGLARHMNTNGTLLPGCTAVARVTGGLR